MTEGLTDKETDRLIERQKYRDTEIRRDKATKRQRD